MRIFDFLKKKELEKIKKMELQIEKMNPILVIENDLQKKQKEVEKRKRSVRNKAPRH